MFRFSLNINSNLFQLTSPILFRSCLPVYISRKYTSEKSQKKEKNVFVLLASRQNQGKFYIYDKLTRNLTDRRNSSLDFEFSTFFFVLLSFFLYKILQSGETYE